MPGLLTMFVNLAGSSTVLCNLLVEMAFCIANIAHITCCTGIHVHHIGARDDNQPDTYSQKDSLALSLNVESSLNC